MNIVTSTLKAAGLFFHEPRDRDFVAKKAFFNMGLGSPMDPMTWYLLAAAGDQLANADIKRLNKNYKKDGEGLSWWQKLRNKPEDWATVPRKQTEKPDKDPAESALKAAGVVAAAPIDDHLQGSIPYSPLEIIEALRENAAIRRAQLAYNKEKGLKERLAPLRIPLSHDEYGDEFGYVLGPHGEPGKKLHYFSRQTDSALPRDGEAPVYGVDKAKNK